MPQLSSTPLSSGTDLYPYPRRSSLEYIGLQLQISGIASILSPSVIPIESILALVDLVLVALHYFALAQWDDHKVNFNAPGPLRAYHRRSLDHILIAVLYHLAAAERVVEPPKVREELTSKQVDYNGEVTAKAEDLEFGKVIPAWPTAEGAAVVPIIDLLSGELLEDVLDPARCLLPRAQWPSNAPRSRVRATDAEWYRIVKRGLELGLFCVCPENEILVDQHGTKVLNGAMGVKKAKVIDGTTTWLQRFIVIMCPSNAYLRRLRGASCFLPYLGRMVLVMLGDDEQLVVNGADMANCFNIFYFPTCWRGYMAFEKRVPASVIGGS